MLYAYSVRIYARSMPRGVAKMHKLYDFAALPDQKMCRDAAAITALCSVVGAGLLQMPHGAV